MSTTYESPTGLDVELSVHPDTPAAWGRLSPNVLGCVDRLATAAAAFDPDWQIDLSIGWNTTNTVHLTAIPATTETRAA